MFLSRKLRSQVPRWGCLVKKIQKSSCYCTFIEAFTRMSISNLYISKILERDKIILDFHKWARRFCLMKKTRVGKSCDSVSLNNTCRLLLLWIWKPHLLQETHPAIQAQCYCVGLQQKGKNLPLSGKAFLVHSCKQYKYLVIKQIEAHKLL